MSVTPPSLPRRIGRLATSAVTWVAGGVAVVGGSVLLSRREQNGTAAQPAGHSTMQDWDHDEHGAETGRGRPAEQPSADSRGAGYELQDVQTSNIRWTMLLYTVVALASVFGMIGMLRLFRANDLASQPRLTAVQTATIEVPGPHLQVDAYGDLNRERGREIGKITGYAWSDASHTEAHIPLERAMTLVVGRPLDTPGLTRFDHVATHSTPPDAAPDTTAIPGAPGTAAGTSPDRGR